MIIGTNVPFVARLQSLWSPVVADCNLDRTSAAAMRQATAPRRGLRRNDAAQYIAISPTKFDSLVADGWMPAGFKVDGCTIWDVRDLDEAFDALKDGIARNPWNRRKGVAA